MKKVFIYLSFLLTFSLTACNEKDQVINIENGEYTRMIFIQTSEIATRALDGTGAFTDRYDPEPDDDPNIIENNDYIYIHSTTDEDKWIRYNIRTDLPSCNGCAGIQFQVKKTENGYTLSGGYAEDGTTSKEVTFNEDEKIYFSSIADERWEGTAVEASPISGQTVLVRDEKKNKELYRSDKDYSISDLITGNNGLSEGLLMKRLCSAFRVYFMFTDLDNAEINEDDKEIEYNITSDEWETETGTKPEDWSVKLYIGPYFSDTYNVNAQEAGWNSGHEDGYYATNNQTYTPFDRHTYTDQEGAWPNIYRGYGLTTSGSDYLITPYDLNHSTGEGEGFMFYAFIKKTTDDISSDEGSKWISYQLDGLIPEFNTTQRIVIIYDYKQLISGFSDANTRSMTETPQKLDIQPAKVIYLRN